METSGATVARRKEGQTKNDKDGNILAFEAWEPVFNDCVRLEKDYYYHPAVDWAKRTGFWRRAREFAVGILTGGVATAFLKDPLARGLGWLWQAVKSLVW